MFCTDIPNTVMVNAVGTALLRDNMVTGKKFATLTADYVFGHDLLRAAKTFFDAHGAQHVRDELIATDVTDFSPYLLTVRQAQPDIGIGRAHVCTPVTHAHLVCSIQLENNNTD